ncbi:MAG: tRNA (adenosine(37)-N6)-threonylcarbamoyltransferase complex dimerization subunit type 1 TsaB [Magnetococcus sp. YQC-9]
MKILAMDSCFPRGGVALLDGERLVARDGFEGPEGHVALLPQAVERLLAESGWSLAELERIAVTLGPGSFSGARIALGVAKGMASGIGLEVVGFSTLEVVAAGSNCDGSVAALLDARRGEVYAAFYEIQLGQTPRLRSELLVCDPETLIGQLRSWQASIDAPLHLTGNALGVYGERLQNLAEAGCRMAEEAFWPLNVALLGRLAARLGRGVRMPVEALEPVYVRKADAKEPAH